MKHFEWPDHRDKYMSVMSHKVQFNAKGRVSKNIDFFQKRTPIIWKPNQQSPEDIDSSTGETYTL